MSDLVENFAPEGKEGHPNISEGEIPPTAPGDRSLQQHPTLTTKVNDAIEKYWLFEFFGWALAAGALIGVIVMLRVYDGRLPPAWKVKAGVGSHRKTYDVTINSVVSLFATVFNSGLSIPVVASMSQLKWIWFQKERRPLADFQTFDSAARGPLGSIILLWTLRCRRLVCVGAVVIIAALGCGFAFQSLVAYPFLPVQVGVSELPISHSDLGVSTQLDFLPSDMTGAIYSGIFQYKEMPEVVVSCSTGNCTWPKTYTTMGICGQCYNVTSELQAACGSYEAISTEGANTPLSPVSLPYCNYSLPNGLELSGFPARTSNHSSLEISGNVGNSSHFDSNKAFSVLSVIQAVWGNPPPMWQNITEQVLEEGILQHSATQCGLFFCAQKYYTTVSQGVLDESLLATYSDGVLDDTSSDFKTYSIRAPESFMNVTNIQDDSNLFVGHQFSALSRFLAKEWVGSLTVNASTGDATAENPLSNFFNPLTFDDFNQMFNTLPAAMTKSIRSIGIENGAQTANGITYQHKPHVHVRWAWIALPASLLALALFLLIGTMIRTAKERTLPWKNSSLAAFSHPLTSDVRAVVTDIQSPTEVKRIAQDLDVKWEKTDRGYRLVRP